MFYIIFIFAFDGIGGGMEWKGPISSKLLFDYLGGTLFNCHMNGHIMRGFTLLNHIDKVASFPIILTISNNITL